MGPNDHKNFYARVVLVLGMGELLAGVDAKRNVRIRRPSTDLASLETACGVNSDLEDTDRSIQRGTRQQLLEVQGKDIRVVHHRSQRCMGHFADKR